MFYFFDMMKDSMQKITLYVQSPPQCTKNNISHSFQNMHLNSILFSQRQALWHELTVLIPTKYTYDVFIMLTRTAAAVYNTLMYGVRVLICNTGRLTDTVCNFNRISTTIVNKLIQLRWKNKKNSKLYMRSDSD